MFLHVKPAGARPIIGVTDLQLLVVFPVLLQKADYLILEVIKLFMRAKFRVGLIFKK